MKSPETPPESGEQALAEASLDLRRALYRVKTFFPSLALSDILLMTGAIEHAASSALSTQGRRKKVVMLGEPWDDASIQEVQPKTRKTRAVKEEAPTPFRVAVLRVLGTQTMTMEEITTGIVERGWFPKTAKTKPRSYINSMMANNKDYFVCVSPGVYRARKSALKAISHEEAPPKEKKPKSTATKSAGSFDRDAVLRHLVSHGQPTTAADIATAVGVPETRALTPLLVGLRDFGAVKKTDGADGKGVWEPIVERIRKWDAERNGGSAFHLNGATPT